MFLCPKTLCLSPIILWKYSLASFCKLSGNYCFLNWALWILEGSREKKDEVCQTGPLTSFFSPLPSLFLPMCLSWTCLFCILCIEDVTKVSLHRRISTILLATPLNCPAIEDGTLAWVVLFFTSSATHRVNPERKEFIGKPNQIWTEQGSYIQVICMLYKMPFWASDLGQAPWRETGSQGDEIRDHHLQPLHGQQEENMAYTYVTFPIYNPLSYISSLKKKRASTGKRPFSTHRQAKILPRISNI